MDPSSRCTVKAGFVPLYRFRFTDWCRKMYDDSVTAFKAVAGLEVCLPVSAPDPAAADPAPGAVPYGALNNLDQAEKVAAYFRMQRVDALIICPLDFGDERSAAKVAELVRVPVLLYATAEPPALTDASLARVSDSYCGNLSLASALYRRKIPFRFAGVYFPGDDRLAAELSAFVQAVSVIKGLTNARIGQVGQRPGSFETVGYDEAELIRKFGQNVIYCNVSDITDRAHKLADDDPAVIRVMAEIKSSFARITVPGSCLVEMAKLEQALVAFWDEQGLSALAMQCWPTVGRLTGIEMCALYGRLTGQHKLTACETDVVGALSMLATYRAILGQSLPFFIDWTIRHREKNNWLLAWHCGNAPVSLASEVSSPALRSRRDMKGELSLEDNKHGALAQFQIKSGPVTLCRLAEYDGQWKMLIASGQVVPSGETLAGTWGWVQVKDHDALYRTLVEEGFIHHASLIHGDCAAALVQACKFLDITPVVVD